MSRDGDGCRTLRSLLSVGWERTRQACHADIPTTTPPHLSIWHRLISRARSKLSAQVVGRRNYRYFIAYVNSVTSLAAFVCVSCGWVVYTVANESDPCATLETSSRNETDQTSHAVDSLSDPATIHGQDALNPGGSQDPSHESWCHDDFLSLLVAVRWSSCPRNRSGEEYTAPRLFACLTGTWRARIGHFCGASDCGPVFLCWSAVLRAVLCTSHCSAHVRRKKCMRRCRVADGTNAIVYCL